MISDESHFNVSLTVRGKVTRQCPETTIFEEKGEPKQFRTEVPLLTSLTASLTARPNQLTLTPACVGLLYLPTAGETNPKTEFCRTAYVTLCPQARRPDGKLSQDQLTWASNNARELLLFLLYRVHLE